VNELKTVQFNDLAKLAVEDMAFSWDGKLLAVLTAETDNELLILEWQAPADRRLKWRIPLGAGFSHVSFCPTDNDQLCITGKGRARTYKFEGAHDVQYSHVDVLPVGLPVDTDLDYTSHCWTITGHIYIATTGGFVLRIDPATGSLAAEAKVIKSAAQAQKILLENNHMITCCADGHIRFYTRHNHQLVADIELGETGIAQACFEESYKKLYIETEQGSLFRLDFAGAVQDSGEYWAVEQLAKDHQGRVSALDVFRSGEPWIASVSQDCTMRIWDFRRKGALGGIKAESALTAIACHPTKPMVAVGSQLGMLRFARCSNVGSDISFRQKLFSSNVAGLHFSLNGDYLACVSGDGHVFFTDGQVENTLQLLAYTKFGGAKVVAACWLLLDLFVAFDNNTVMQLTAPALSMKNEEQSAPETPWATMEAPITAIQAGASMVFVLTADATLTCFDATGAKVHTFNDHQKQPDAMAVSLDGRLVATGGRDGMMYVRSTDFEKVQYLQAHDYLEQGVGVLKFSVSGEQLFSAGNQDKMFSMWALNNTNHMTRGRESELVLLDDSEIEVSVEIEVLDDIAAKVREAEEALHAEERANLRSKVAALKAKLDNLIQSNETAPDLEKMDRKELVIDFETRDLLQEENEERVETVRDDTRFKNLGYDLIASRIKKEAWSSMTVQGKTITPFNGEVEHCRSLVSFPIRKRSRAEKSKLASVRMLRSVERAEMLQRTKKAGGEKKSEEAADDGAPEAAAEEEFFDANKVGTEANQTLLYDWFETYTPQRKRSQIVLLDAVIQDTAVEFNKLCEKMLTEKEGVINFIKKNNERITTILFELDLEEEVKEPVLSEQENPDLVLECDSKEISVEKFKTKAQLDEEARVAREEEARLAAMEDNIFERALEDFMHGTLEVKKEEINLREAFAQEDWMVSLEPNEMSEDQKKELEVWKVSKAKFDEEADKYRRNLEAELKKIKGDIDEATVGYDNKLSEAYRKMLASNRRIYEYELRMIALAQSLQQSSERDLKVKQMEGEHATVSDLQVHTSHARREYHIDLEKSTEEYQALVQEERGMEKQFKKEIGELVEPEQVNLLMGLYKKRNRPMRRASVVALRNASLRVMQQYKPKGAGRGRKRRTSLAEVVMALNNPEPTKDTDMDEMEDDLPPALQEGTESPYDGILDLLVKKRKRPTMKLGEHRLPLHEYPEGLSDLAIEKLDRSRDDKIEKELRLAVMSDQIKDMNLKFAKICKDDETANTKKSSLAEKLDGLYEEQRRGKFNMDVLFSLKQGQVEVEQAAVVTDFSDSIMIHRGVVDDVNASIRKLWAEKLEIMKESKSVRGEFAKQKWEQERLDMTFEDLTEKTREFQLQRVTKSLQELIKSGVGVEARKEAEITTLERKIEFYQNSFEAKVKERKAKLAKLRQTTKELQDENWQLDEDIRELEISVSERKKIYDLKFEHQEGGNNVQRAKFNEAVARKRLVDIAKAQAEEVEFLREELTRLRQRTFPSFSHLAPK